MFIDVFTTSTHYETNRAFHFIYRDSFLGAIEFHIRGLSSVSGATWSWFSLWWPRHTEVEATEKLFQALTDNTRRTLSWNYTAWIGGSPRWKEVFGSDNSTLPSYVPESGLALRFCRLLCNFSLERMKCSFFFDAHEVKIRLFLLGNIWWSYHFFILHSLIAFQTIFMRLSICFEYNNIIAINSMVTDVN